MFLFLFQKIKIKNLKVVSFVFISLFALSFAVFSFADDTNIASKNIFQDTDQDGLSNDEEKLYGTDSNKADTDGDGYSDGTEIKSGYDPLKPAPGDKIMAAEDASTPIISTQNNTIDSEKTNLTEEVSKQVARTLKESSSTKQDISLEDLKNTVQQTVNNSITTDALPEVDVKSIKIKKQKYEGLSEADRTAKIKEDALAYITEVSFILVNNSPITMQSGDDMSKLASFVMSNVTGMITGSDGAMLNDFTQKGVLITEQLSSITVPENMLELHIKALRLAQYATTFKDKIQSGNNSDPLAQINALAKMQGFLGLSAEFSNDMQATLVKNGLPNIPI